MMDWDTIAVPLPACNDPCCIYASSYSRCTVPQLEAGGYRVAARFKLCAKPIARAEHEAEEIIAERFERRWYDVLVWPAVIILPWAIAALLWRAVTGWIR